MIEPEPMHPALACESLTLGHRLQEVSLHLEPGLTVAVVGPNGAGKSTLIQVLAGLLHAQGQIRWNGQELARIPFLLRGRTLAWLGQESHAEFAFPVRDVVAQGRHAWGDDDQGVDEVMDLLDLRDLAARPVTELSGGERRRVFLARALATQAPLQLWDEPTSNLDVRHSLEVLALAMRLARAGGTLLVSLHDLRQAFRFDRVAVLDRGHLVGYGRPHEVLTKDLIRSVFRVEATFVESLVLELLPVTRAISVLGSGSDVGKSLVTAGLCRLLADAGLDVVPFKAQNMANQAGVTPEGLEMPRAQILQAAACRKAPHVDMGPVLMKPVTSTGAQIVVLGKAVGEKSAREYFQDTAELSAIALAALDRLRAEHEVVVMEGAGSPVELNLWTRDYVNLRPAAHAGAAIILVVDIHKGGVFAQAKGTLDLLPATDRARVLGLVVNRFMGDLGLFEEGIPLLEEICGAPVLAVLPHLEHGLDEEDRPIRIPVDQRPEPGKLHAGALLSPRVANTEDLAPLLCEPDVQLTWLTDPRLVPCQDLLILPGSKATLGDLAQHAASGMAEAVRESVPRGAWILGLCGGYQMLGAELLDEAASEGGPRAWPGLGLLPVRTVFRPEKTTTQSRCISAWPEAGHALAGYEIHQGRTEHTGEGGEPLAQGCGAELGWRQDRACGSYLHGLLASDAWRGALLNEIRRDRGLSPQPVHLADPLEARLARWAAHLRAHLRPGAWARLLAAAKEA